jgi:large subunit ribosomal protein L15
LRDLEVVFANGDRVTPRDLAVKKLVKTPAGRIPMVKILGLGKLTKKLTVTGCEVSRSAKEAIEKAGGTVVV